MTRHQTLNKFKRNDSEGKSRIQRTVGHNCSRWRRKAQLLHNFETDTKELSYGLLWLRDSVPAEQKKNNRYGLAGSTLIREIKNDFV